MPVSGSVGGGDQRRASCVGVFVGRGVCTRSVREPHTSTLTLTPSPTRPAYRWPALPDGDPEFPDRRYLRAMLGPL